MPLIQRLHQQPLIEPVRAAAFRRIKHAADAVGPDAGVVEEAPVGGAGGHHGDHGDAGPHVGADALHRAHQFRRERRYLGFGGVTHGGDLDLLVGHHFGECGLHVRYAFARQNTAIHGGFGALR